MGRFTLTAMLLAAILGCGGDSADKYIQEGFVNFQQQKYDEAIACYETAIKLEPRAPTAYNMMGMAYRFKYNRLGSRNYVRRRWPRFKRPLRSTRKIGWP